MSWLGSLPWATMPLPKSNEWNHVRVAMSAANCSVSTPGFRGNAGVVPPTPWLITTRPAARLASASGASLVRVQRTAGVRPGILRRMSRAVTVLVSPS